MNTVLKISLGFVLGVVCTIGVLIIMGKTRNTEEDQLKEEIRIKALKNLKQSLDKTNMNENGQENIHSFEINTKNGIVKLHTYMSKDSVQILMGRPQTTNINDYGQEQFGETWSYRGTNKYIDEFTIEFVDGKLQSVRQFKDH